MSVAIRFPGTSGNYQSTADVNLLDADTAHSYQAVGNKDSYASSTINSTPQTNALSFSGKATQWSFAWAAYNGFRFGYTSPFFAVDPSTEYTVAFKADIPSEWGTSVRVRVSRDVAGATDHTVTRVDGENVYYNTFTTGASDATIKVQVDCPLSDGTASGSDTIDVYDFVLREGSDATFVPSLRIVGDLDYRIQMSLSDVMPDSAMYLGSVWTAAGSQKSWHAYLTTSGAITWLWTEDGATNKTTGTAALGLPVADTSQEWRLVFDVDNGASGRTLSVYIDGVLDKSVTSATATSLFPAASIHSIGASGTTANLAADVYYTELRDGIDGPIVRRMDAADWIGTT